MISLRILEKRALTLMSAVLGLSALTFANDHTPASPSSVSQIFARRQVFPKDNPWNSDISRLPVDPRSAAYIAAIGMNKPLHPDFGTGTNGIPFQFVDHNTPHAQVTFEYADESDKGPYPIPAHPLIEGGAGGTSGDRHLLLIDQGAHLLRQGTAGWKIPRGGHHLLTNGLNRDSIRIVIYANEDKR